MAAPLKRICRQAARQVSQCRNISIASQSRTQNLQCRRAFSHSSQRLQTTDQDETYDPAEEVLSSLPSPSGLSSTAHAELEQHQELREMVRVAAWEMPLLTPLAKPYEKPDKQKLPLRWRYTTYFGEPHPASRKVVVEFKVGSHLDGLDGKQMEKLKKLCGARWNPETNLVKMSCESFETQAQNKRFLGDTIQKLLAEAKDSTDTFEDIPLDTRHHKSKERFRFPEEWKMTQEKMAALEEKRRHTLLAEGRAVEENRVISGAAAIEEARRIKLAQVEQAVMAEARQPLPRGKMGQREMGQTGGAQRRK